VQLHRAMCAALDARASRQARCCGDSGSSSTSPDSR
jgi:hypothetical protein